MSKPPRNYHALDLCPAIDIVSGEPTLAKAAYLAVADSRQHALMTSWGGPAYYMGLMIVPAASSVFSTKTVTVTLAVPPNVLYTDLTVLATGSNASAPGYFEMTTSADVPGTRLDFTEGFNSHKTSGITTSVITTSNRAVQIAAVRTWRWQNQMAHIKVGGNASVLLHGVLFRWIHQNA